MLGSSIGDGIGAAAGAGAGNSLGIRGARGARTRGAAGSWYWASLIGIATLLVSSKSPGAERKTTLAIKTFPIVAIAYDMNAHTIVNIQKGNTVLRVLLSSPNSFQVPLSG